MAKDLIKTPEVGIVTRKGIDDWLMGSGTKLTEQQKALFYQIASSFNLNPAKREIYAIAYGSGFNVIVGYEVYLKRAERTGLLEWWEATVEKRDNEWVGICTIKRTDRSRPTSIEAWFSEYNQGNVMWKNKPRTMIRKVAIAQAFRMVFSDELGGMPYTSDEMSGDPKVVDFGSVQTVGGPPPPTKAPAPDTSEFDKLLAAKNLDASDAALFENFMTETAAKQVKPLTPAQLRAGLVKKFEAVYDAFLAFKSKPPTPPPPAEEGPNGGTPPDEVDAATDQEVRPAPEPQSVLKDRAKAAWSLSVVKGIPHADRVAKTGIEHREDLNADNIDNFEAYVTAYTSPKKGHK